jgi:hypothetical protein
MHATQFCLIRWTRALGRLEHGDVIPGSSNGGPRHMESGLASVYAQPWHGSTANAMPPAIGAQEALPDCQVVLRPV